MDPSTSVPVELIEKQRLYAYAAGMSLLAYDYLLTLPTEVDYVWATKWTPGKDVAMRNSQSVCTVVVYLAVCNTMAAYTLAGLVIGLRTWAIWNRSRACGVLLLMIWSCMIIGAGYYGIVAMLGITVDANLPMGGCGTLDNTTTTEALVKAYIAVAAYETIVFMATLARGLHYLRFRSSTVTFVLYRDAFVASICLLAIAILNAVLDGAFSTSFYDSYFVGRVLCAILPTRIILNLREASLSVDAWDAGTEVPAITENSFALTDVDNGRSAAFEHS